ncbi:MAG: NAD(P)H-dependent glycerol-3-phosphate dehydrogenase [Pseudomonadota bacterium]
MSLAVLGAGAFGTSLAIALAHDACDVVLWGRDAAEMARMQESRRSGHRLPGHELPESLTVTSDLSEACRDICLLALPMQKLASFLYETPIASEAIVACCKGIHKESGLGPTALLRKYAPSSAHAVLTGPSFAQDIASGLPTALVLAAPEETAKKLQVVLARPALRIYRTTDVTGAELGGALKNVVALAAGIAIGAGLGDSARASVIARGFAEISRYAVTKGARPDTLSGLSGLGDLVLTCTSDKSRNFTAGIALGQGRSPGTHTVEGLATALAVAQEAEKSGIDLPLLSTIAHVIEGNLDIQAAITTLLSRPVGTE